jgi:hypothetical protein
MNCLSAGNSFITKFTSKFSPTLSSRSIFHMGDIETHVALKYTKCANHKQTPTHEPHCSSCNIMPPSGPHVNCFPSFQTLSAIRHIDSSAKFSWPRGKQGIGRREMQSRGPVLHSKNIACSYLCINRCNGSRCLLHRYGLYSDLEMAEAYMLVYRSRVVVFST